MSGKRPEEVKVATAEAPVIAPVITEIGPEEANALLTRNTHNRKLRRNFMYQLAGAMERGEWTFNGDPIRIAEDGTLLDGQHRLAAVVHSDLPQQFLVIDGLPQSAQETMDSGAKRTVGDILRLRGEMDVNRLAAMVRLVLHYEQGQSFRIPFTKPTSQQLIACLDRHPGIRDAVPASRPAIKYTQAASGPMGACYYLFSQVDAADAEAFTVSFAHGAGLPPGSPIFAVRRIFTNPRPRGGIPSVYQGAVLIKAWNLWRRGETIQHLRWNAGGSQVEKFPLVDGLNWEEL